MLQRRDDWAQSHSLYGRLPILKKNRKRKKERNKKWVAGQHRVLDALSPGSLAQSCRFEHEKAAPVD